jgi:uncharacterized protein (TIGR03790 family)
MQKPSLVKCLSLLLGFAAGLSWANVEVPVVSFPRSALTSRDLGIVINELDPLSVRVGEYYQRVRAIPAENVVRLRLSVNETLSAAEFVRSKKILDRQMPARVQALALAWLVPYRVDCMSITSAFAFGFERSYCASGCERTPYSRYFNSDSRQPYTDMRIRPAMLLAARDFERAKALIDRGVSADRQSPRSTAYLLQTSDVVRSVRAASYSSVKLLATPDFKVHIETSDAIRNRADVMFYFTGITRVDGLQTNNFLPGAIADHLTSHGGRLIASSQMSALRWLEAGATASYGTVVEPCAFVGKFPSVPIVIQRYRRGETLIEAYWKSVAMPAQGVFVGEPLAAPFGGHRVVFDGQDLLIETRGLLPGRYELIAATSLVGPYERLRDDLILRAGLQQIRIRDVRHAVYELRPR